MRAVKLFMGVAIALSIAPFALNAQNNPEKKITLSRKEQSIIRIAAVTAKGDLPRLKTELNTGLQAGLTISQIKEVIIHIYAYAGFPRSIRGLQTFMTVLDERRAIGINDVPGTEASPVNSGTGKYQRGKAIVETLTGIPEAGTKAGYAVFAPAIEIFLKEHLFADIFERDILTHPERELVTISVLSSIGGVEPMLQSHLKICLNIGITSGQLLQFTEIIKTTAGRKAARVAQKALNEVLRAGK